MKTGTCFIYCRQSSGSDDAGGSVSIQQQLANCRACAESRNLRVAEAFADANVSGKTYPDGPEYEAIAQTDRGFNQWFANQTSRKKFRPGLGKLLRRVSEVEYIVVDEITRLHRAAAKSFLEAAINFRIVEAGVKILQVKGGVIDLGSFDQSLIQMLRTRINDEQIANQRNKSRESRRRIRDSGILGGAHFFGALRDGPRRFRFDPVRAPVIQELFRRTAAGEPYSRLIRDLNRDHRALFAPARMVYESTLRLILSQPAYAGLMRDSGGDLIECRNAPEPLITPALFHQVRRIMEDRRARRSRPRTNTPDARTLPFSGILRCGVCGDRMAVYLDGDSVSYVCRRVSLLRADECRRSRILVNREGRDCPGLRHAVTPLLLLAFLNRAARLKNDRGDLDRLETMDKRIAELRRKLEHIFRQWCEGECDDDVYRDISNEWNAKLREMKLRRLEVAGGREVDFDAGLRELEKEFAAFLADPDPDDPRYAQLLRDAVGEIAVDARTVRIETRLGILNLPRDIRSSKRKWMPLWQLRTLRIGGESLFSENCRFELVYDYRHDPTEELFQPRFLTRLGPLTVYQVHSQK